MAKKKREGNAKRTTPAAVFSQCVAAIRNGELIQRVSSTDKEYHFQYWFQSRLAATGANFEVGGRNTYPDFRMVHTNEGYELKGLAYPGRDASFDSNSQVPTGFHNGREVYYVFGRYPKHPDGSSYPVLDLVVCHGDFLNADHEYVHENKSVKAFGTYGDILIRDRKMYVVPTPFRLLNGVAHQQTLLLPSNMKLPSPFKRVGEVSRREADRIVIGYAFDLQTNELTTKSIANPSAGREHQFTAWRLKDSDGPPVTERQFTGIGEISSNDEATPLS